MQRFVRRKAKSSDLQPLTPSRERRVVRGLEAGADHDQNGPDEALRLAHGQAKDESERQDRFDRKIREPLLPSGPTGRRHSPRSLSVWREPQRHIAATDERALVRPPIPHTVLCLVGRMELGLHPSIMPPEPGTPTDPRLPAERKAREPCTNAV